ncbi:hypothetical protein EC973_003127 [Apophysomyces ossiformis]|uniref:Uncharacterized protein n=1 Tax=Apophysomyces ossiformis TaxID=679940 RepID=A0A8H7BMV2_9FUNG|nr:hypothetical protein EC973_003127 [Apophysomyces ossiformis]
MLLKGFTILLILSAITTPILAFQQDVPGFSVPGIVTVGPSYRSKDPAMSLVEACTTGNVQLVVHTTALGGRTSSDGICDIDLNSTAPQKCPVTGSTGNFFGLGKCGVAIVTVKDVDGGKQIFTTIGVAMSGSVLPPRVTKCAKIAKRWDINKSKDLPPFFCPTH